MKVKVKGNAFLHLLYKAKQSKAKKQKNKKTKNKKKNLCGSHVSLSSS
jgi:hypothetical protein